MSTYPFDGELLAEAPLRNYAPGDMNRNPRGNVPRKDQGAQILARELHGVELYEWRRRQMRRANSPRGR